MHRHEKYPVKIMNLSKKKYQMLLIFGRLDDNKTKKEKQQQQKINKIKVSFTNSHIPYCDMCMSSNKIVSFEYVLTSWMWEKKWVFVV